MRRVSLIILAAVFTRALGAERLIPMEEKPVEQTHYTPTEWSRRKVADAIGANYTRTQSKLQISRTEESEATARLKKRLLKMQDFVQELRRRSTSLERFAAEAQRQAEAESANWTEKASEVAELQGLLTHAEDEATVISCWAERNAEATAKLIAEAGKVTADDTKRIEKTLLDEETIRKAEIRAKSANLSQALPDIRARAVAMQAATQQLKLAFLLVADQADKAKSVATVADQDEIEAAWILGVRASGAYAAAHGLRQALYPEFIPPSGSAELSVWAPTGYRGVIKIIMLLVGFFPSSIVVALIIRRFCSGSSAASEDPFLAV